MNLSRELRSLVHELLTHASHEDVIVEIASDLDVLAGRIEAEALTSDVERIRKRYESYGERYSWKKEQWEPVEEVTVTFEASTVSKTNPDESLQEEVDILQGLLGDLRRENLQLQNEVDTKTKGR
jgi:polyhydroxyalkanoate synthesis regulator phasin